MPTPNPRQNRRPRIITALSAETVHLAAPHLRRTHTLITVLDKVIRRVLAAASLPVPQLPGPHLAEAGEYYDGGGAGGPAVAGSRYCGLFGVLDQCAVYASGEVGCVLIWYFLYGFE